MYLLTRPQLIRLKENALEIQSSDTHTHTMLPSPRHFSNKHDAIPLLLTDVAAFLALVCVQEKSDLLLLACFGPASGWLRVGDLLLSFSLPSWLKRLKLRFKIMTIRIMIKKGRLRTCTTVTGSSYFAHVDL